MNIFNLLNEQERSLFKKIEIDKDQILFKEGERCKYLGILIGGSLSISSYTYSGREIIYRNVLPNEFFGNNLIFSNNPIYKGNVIAKTNKTIIYLIDKDSLVSLLQRNKEFLLNFLEVQSESGLLTNIKIKILSFDRAEDRLLYFLHESNNCITYKSITDLAKFLYLERETLSRLISKLEKDGIVVRSSNKIQLK